MPVAALRVARSGWIPTGLVIVLAGALLLRFEVAPPELIRFGAYLLGVVVLPGTLIWRALRGTPRSLFEDLACGAVLGYALEIGVYIIVRWLNVPLLILAWPAVVLILFLAVPKLRGHVRPIRQESVPPVFSWFIAALVAIMILWLSISYFRTHPLSGPIAAFPYIDITYQLALAADVKHHMPPQRSYILGEPLDYYWFTHADLAASSWGSGVELRTVLLRFQIFPFAALGLILTGLLAVRITGRWWTGPFAAASAFLVSGFSPFSWMSAPIGDEVRPIQFFAWASPTHTVGLALFAPIPLLLLDRFRREPGGRGNWVLITILLAAGMGTKATAVPLFLAGLAFTLVFVTLFWRKYEKRAIQKNSLLGIGIGIVLFLFSTFVLYGGESYGLRFDPLASVRHPALAWKTGLPAIDAGLPLTTSIAILGLTILNWFMRGIGALGLVKKPDDDRPRIDAIVLMMVGILLGSLGVLFLFGHPGGSQVYFFRTAIPFIGVIAACGVSRLVPDRYKTLPITLSFLAAALVGWAAVVTVTRVNGPAIPTGRIVVGLVGSVALVFAFIAAAALIVWLVRLKFTWLRGITAALVLVALTGTGLYHTFRETRNIVEDVATNGLDPVRLDSKFYPIAPGALDAARWLRDNSSPDDIVATNAHCAANYKDNCDNRHFWVAGYTERRILVEGWGYTAYAVKGGATGTEVFYYTKYWDQERLANNDRAFSDPSEETIDLLATEYGVRWLFVDERYNTPDPRLGQFAELRYRSGDCAIYEIR